jgi:hypothetical protein
MIEGKKETHVHEWWLEERRMGGMVMRYWTCRVPGCKSPPIRSRMSVLQVTDVGAPYPDLPETEEVQP